MHKVGDKFQVIVARDGDEKVCAGDVVTLQRVVNSYGAEFITESGEGFVAEFEGTDVGVGRIVRPVSTEPEYKEIPFSEATHEQRMDVDMVVHVDGEKPIEAFFTKADVYVYQFASMWLPLCIPASYTIRDGGLKIRIPA